jgi:hypothetical protein
MMFFAVYYIRWHYSQALLDLIGIVRNFIWFFFEFFSIPLLLATLFSPFHRLGERYVNKLDIGKIAEAFIINTLMRFVGFGLRIFLIVTGVFFILLTFILGLFFFIAWVLAPLLLVFLLLYGIKLLSLG